jgi:hypothetical protein
VSICIVSVTALVRNSHPVPSMSQIALIVLAVTILASTRFHLYKPHHPRRLLDPEIIYFHFFVKINFSIILFFCSFVAKFPVRIHLCSFGVKPHFRCKPVSGTNGVCIPIATNRKPRNRKNVIRLRLETLGLASYRKKSRLFTHVPLVLYTQL